MSQHKCCHEQPKRVDRLYLEDGRLAERHVFVDENGNEVVEIFAEEKKPLKLEKRIVREKKEIVAKEVHEKVKDGEVVEKVVMSAFDEKPLKVVERIGVADHAKLVDDDYVKKEELKEVIKESVVAAVATLVEKNDKVLGMDKKHSEEKQMTARMMVEQNVAKKKKNDTLVNAVLMLIVMAQVGFLGYLLLMN